LHKVQAGHVAHSARGTILIIGCLLGDKEARAGS